MANNAHIRDIVEDTIDEFAEQEQPLIHRGDQVMAATSTATSGQDTAANCSAQEEAHQQQHHAPPSVIVEDKVFSMILSIIVRHETPRYIELDYIIMDDEFQ